MACSAMDSMLRPAVSSTLGPSSPAAAPWPARRQLCSRPRARQWRQPTCAAAATADSRAVVVGGGMAGLAAAQVLSRYFEEVVLLERDTLPPPDQGVVQDRPGVPQFRMPHGLLLGGLLRLEALFPGFKEQLLAEGGVEIDWGQDCDFRDMQVVFARGPSPIRTVCGTRALFEHVARAMVCDNSRINMRTGSPVTGLHWGTDGRAVAGVEVQNGEALPAALVIDTSGRASRVRAWLEAAGWSQPRELVVDAKVGYATRIYKIPEGYAGPKAVLCGTRPTGTRSGLLAPIEGGRWNVILSGYGGDHPPTDEEGFLAFAASLPAPSLAAAMAVGEPLSPIMRYQGTQNVRRLWEEVPLPAGLGVMGDAVTALNPVFGQGMAVAGMECEALDRVLQRRLSGRGSSTAEALQGFPEEFQRAVAATVEQPWTMAVTEDLSFLTTVTNIPAEQRPQNPSTVADYFQALALAASKDPAVCTRFCSVMHLADPPAALFAADMVSDVQALAGGGRSFDSLVARG